MRDQGNSARPEILEGLDYEQTYIQTSSSSRARRRVELKNRGDAWLMRFLPVRIGPKGRYYARIATHWLNRKPSICPRHTEPDWGGDPTAYCPVCELSDDLNADRNEKVSKFGWDIRAGAQWHTYCAVFEKVTNGGDPVPQPLNEILQPYEFNHYKNTWEELTAAIKQNVRRTPLSVLDFVQGNDFWLTKTGKGLRLDKQDSAPIFDPNDENFAAWTDKLLKNVKEPNVKMPDAQAMEDFADKAREEAAKISSNRSAPEQGRRTGGGDEEYLPPRQPRSYAQEAAPEDAQPARPAARPAAAPARPAAAAPARRPAAPPPPVQEEQEPVAEAQEEQPAEEYQLGDAPAEEAPAAEEPPTPPPAPVARPAARPAAAPVAARPAARPAAAPVAPARPNPITPARAAAAATAAAATARPAAAPARTAAAPARPSSGAQIAQESLDEEEMVAEEKIDPAPAAPLGEEVDAGDPPPAVEQTGQAAPKSGALGSNIRNRIAAVGTKR